jgi:hypothetical protein
MDVYHFNVALSVWGAHLPAANSAVYTTKPLRGILSSLLTQNTVSFNPKLRFTEMIWQDLEEFFQNDDGLCLIYSVNMA